VLATAVLAVIVIAALGVLSGRALREASIRRQVAAALAENSRILGLNAEVAGWDVEIGQDLNVSVSVETSEDITTAQTLDLQLALTERLGQPTALQVTVIPVRRIAPSLLSEQ